MNLVEYPSDEVLKERYQQIERSAKEGIRNGLLVGNSILSKQFRRGGWSISTHGLVSGSSAGSFLASAQEILDDTAVFEWIQESFLHVTLTELIYDSIKRRISPQEVKSYQDALLRHFPQQFDPIRLHLNSIIPTLDREEPGKEGRTGAVVGAFLTEGNNTIFRVKEELVKAVQVAELPLSARLGGPPRVLFVTLGRFVDPPYRSEQGIPLLEKLDSLNNELLSADLYTNITAIHTISTSPLDYASSRGHIEVWPPVALQAENQFHDSTRFLTSSKRRFYYNKFEISKKQ